MTKPPKKPLKKLVRKLVHAVETAVEMHDRRAVREEAAFYEPVGTERRPLSATARAAFLKALGQTHVVSKACRISGVSRSSVEHLMKNNKFFMNACIDAKRDAAEALEYAAYIRARDGTKSLMVSDGQVVRLWGLPVYETKYHDSLHGLMLKAIGGPAYKDKPTEVKVTYDPDTAAIAARFYDNLRKLGEKTPSAEGDESVVSEDTDSGTGDSGKKSRTD